MSDPLVTWAGRAFPGSITVFAIGVLVEVPFLQPLAGIGRALASVGIARAAGATDCAGADMVADGVTLR
jgi:hypothetical protein